jgi:predicted porin
MEALAMRAALACLALACADAGAQENVQVYGRLQVALEHFRSGTRVSSYRSVLGFRGSEDLGGGLRAIFQVEGALALDTGAGSIAARDTRVGLEGGWGTLFAGHWATPYSSATSGLDPFYTTAAGYSNIIGRGSAPSTDHVIDTSSFDRRQHNTLAYWSPAWHGVSLRIAHGLGEQDRPDGARPSLTSAAAIYEQGAWYLAVAHEQHHDYLGAGRSDHGSKIGAAYRFGATRIAAVAEVLRHQRRSVFLSATHQFGPHSLRASAGARQYTVGYDYAFSRRSSVFAYYTHLQGTTLQGSAVGLRHWF